MTGRPPWFNPYYRDRVHLFPNPYVARLDEFPAVVIYPRQAEERRGHWSPDGGTVAVEIGCAEGDFLVEEAQRQPGRRFVGLDQQFKRVCKAAETVTRLKLPNVALVRYDAMFIEELFAPGECDALYLFFPDPWPKERHRKHRMVQGERLEAWRRLLAPGGVIEMKTDHADYWEQMRGEVGRQSWLQVEASSDDLVREPALAAHLSPTRFERMFMKLGKPVRYLRLRRCD